VIKDAAGSVTEVHGTYDPASKGGNAPDGRKVKGTIHWVSVKDAVQFPVRLYDRLFTVPNPMGDATKDFLEFLNPDSAKTITAYGEPALAQARPGEKFQFERIGYFCADSKDTKPGAPVFNRTVTLRDASPIFRQRNLAQQIFILRWEQLVTLITARPPSSDA
jgi:glutaminyl-tRNA synthetase